MKKFLVKLTIFLLPLVVCCAVAEVELAGLPNTYSQKRADLERQLGDIQILILGPSHALHGIDPAFFSHKGYNLANASQTIFYDKEITLRYFDRLSALRLVIIPISYNTMYTQLWDSKEGFRKYFYSKYWGIDAPGMPLLDLRRYSHIALYTPQTTVEFAAKGFNVDLLEGLAPSGYLRYDTAGSLKNISWVLGAKRVELYRRMMKQEHYAENVEALTQLVTTLRRRNVQVCFITTPVFKTFGKYCEQSVIEGNIAAIKDICLAHGCGYKNYFSDKRFSITDFYDNDHLNFIGAASFSRILDSEVVSRVNFH